MTPRFRAFVPAALLCLGAVPLAAQSAPRPPTAAAVRRAVDAITEADVRARIGVIADDSMRGRATPSPELDEVAAYIAGEFRSFGLRPGGDSGTYFQRYRIRRTQVDSSSFVMLMGRGATSRLALGREVAAIAPLPVGDSTITAPAVLLVGMPTDSAQPFGGVDVRGAVLVQELPLAALMNRRNILPFVTKAIAAGVRGIVILANVPSTMVAAQGRNLMAPSYALDLPQSGGPVPIPLLIARDSSAIEVLRAAGEDLAALRDSSTHAIRPLTGVTVTLSARRRVIAVTTAPNVVGVLPGSDPQLAGEYVFFTGHMDHIGVVGGGQGCAAIGADSICNGADDDASGTIGVVELAQAFSQLTPRPRRTLVFMTVSGEERGLWGSTWYSEHPEFPLAQTVADLNTDMIGRYYNNQPGWRDTIVVIGKEHSSLGEVANRVTRDHPELHMQMIDDIWPSENFYRRSDHFNFARKGVPILFFFNGVHPDYHRAGDSVDKIDAEKEARIVRMVFYIGLDVANATARPQWNPASRREIVEPGN
jgi:hypothetical protein